MLTTRLDEIEQRARTVDPRRAALTALVFIPYVLGWLARKTWMTLAYVWSATVAGWHGAAGTPTQGDGRPYGRS